MRLDVASRTPSPTSCTLLWVQLTRPHPVCTPTLAGCARRTADAGKFSPDPLGMAVLTVQTARILTPPTTAIAPACSSEAVASAAFALVFAPPSLDVSPPTKLPLAHGGSVRSRKPPRLQPFYCGGGGSARGRPKQALPPTTHVQVGCPRSFFAAEDPRTHSARLPSPSLAIWV